MGPSVVPVWFRLFPFCTWEGLALWRFVGQWIPFFACVQFSSSVYIVTFGLCGLSRVRLLGSRLVYFIVACCFAVFPFLGLLCWHCELVSVASFLSSVAVFLLRLLSLLTCVAVSLLRVAPF